MCYTVFTKQIDHFNWCKEQQNWSERQWSHVLFIEETRFSFTGDSKRVYVWWESVLQNYPSNIIELNRFSSGRVIVLGLIMVDGLTPLHIFNSGSETGQRYL